MSIAIYILIVTVAAVIIGGLVGFAFDYLLAKGVFRLIVGKAKNQLDGDKLKDAFDKMMENRRQKWAFKTYMGLVIVIVGGGGLIPIKEANFIAAIKNNAVGFKLIVDAGVSPWVIVVGVICATLAYFGWLYFSNNRYKKDVISSSLKLINEELAFVPNQDWFKKKSERSIKDLGKKINLSINFKYELYEDALASTCRDERLAQRFVEERSQLLSEFGRAKERLAEKMGKKEVDSISNNVMNIVDSLSLTHMDGQALDDIVNMIDKVESEFRDAIMQRTLDYDDYGYTNIHSALGRIRNHIENPWIQSVKNQTLLVYGRGGQGKTHLLAKMVQSRLEENLPTIFFLGKLITDTSIPLGQMLTSLDIRCKKETFCKALNDYGREHGRVLIVVDGINEGKGLSLWKNHLMNFLNEFAPYEYIGVIVSVRTTGGNNWFSRFIREEGFPSYEHRGFERNVSGAVQYMFKSFNVPLPNWPILNQEFRNPMLLTLFCRSHQGEKMPPNHETRLEIIMNYIRYFNERLSVFFQYSSSSNVLLDVLHQISAQMINKGSRWQLRQGEMMTILAEHPVIGDKAGTFLTAMVDEGLLDEYEYLGKETYYSIGYDTIGSYLIAETMVDEGKIEGDLIHDEAVLEALTDVMPAKTGRELFEVLSDEETGYSMKELFLDRLPARTILTDAGNSLLMDIMENGLPEELFEIVTAVPYQSMWVVNADVLDKILKPMSIVERDHVWTETISSYGRSKDNIDAYVSWAWSASDDVLECLNRYVKMYIARLLVWTLTTTDLALRDKATRALVNLLRTDSDIMCQIMADYTDVNDDYIVERLYAVAFGCCAGSQDCEGVSKIAQLTYDSVFRNGNPRENILIRDYAKCIIDYAIALGCRLDMELERTCEPYCKQKKNVYVATADIKKYDWEYYDGIDKELYWAQKNIMDSMRTEYSSRGMYGDFGRYTFQAMLDNWEDDIEQISNYAIKYIFEEIGYDPKLFKKFDGQYSSMNRHKNTIERIGKKYQWIALYKVAAILSDNHYGEKARREWRSSVRINARKFDPTLFMNPDMKDYTEILPAWRVPEFKMSLQEDEQWMKNWRLMPDIKNYIEITYGGKTWVNLFSYNTISSNVGYERHEMEGKCERELWAFVQAFMVDESKRKKLCKTIHKEGLGGRSATENREMYSIYYREYYWSECYKKEIEEAGLTRRMFDVGQRSTDIEVYPAYLLYSISEYADASLSSSMEVEMPSPYLFESLGLRFSQNDGVWLAEDGSVACFDNYWVNGGQGCLLYRKDLLLKYLEREKKSLVWPILMERTIRPSSSFWPRTQAGGYVWMDAKGRIRSRFRSYEEKWADKKKRWIKNRMSKTTNKARLWLYRRGLLKMSGTEAIWLMMESRDDDDEN